MKPRKPTQQELEDIFRSPYLENNNQEVKTVNLAKLFEVQRGLDEHIMEEHPELRGQDNLDWKILALQVELGECANEWRGFKKWSKNQEPVTNKMEIGFADPGGPFQYFRNPLLEEYVDCLHFILSIGLELEIQDEWDIENIEGTTYTNVIHQFLDFNEYLNADLDDNDWFSIMENFIGLGEMLGFTRKQIEQAYMDKNKINHERQESGY